MDLTGDQLHEIFLAIQKREMERLEKQNKEADELLRQLRKPPPKINDQTGQGTSPGC